MHAIIESTARPAKNCAAATGIEQVPFIAPPDFHDTTTYSRVELMIEILDNGLKGEPDELVCALYKIHSARLVEFPGVDIFERCKTWAHDLEHHGFAIHPYEAASDALANGLADGLCEYAAAIRSSPKTQVSATSRKKVEECLAGIHAIYVEAYLLRHALNGLHPDTFGALPYPTLQAIAPTPSENSDPSDR